MMVDVSPYFLKCVTLDAITWDDISVHYLILLPYLEPCTDIVAGNYRRQKFLILQCRL
jgi:hypothetical protein